MKGKIILCICFTLASSILKAQDSSTDNTSIALKETLENPHSIKLELLGRTFLFGSLNYEYALNQKASFGAGLGLINFQIGDILRQNNGAPEEGRFRDISSSQMIYGNYFIGKKKHQLHLTAGLTHFLFTNRNKYDSETEFSAETHLEWNAGVGYQLVGERIYFRATAYVISLPESSSWFPRYMPWAGVSLGYKIP